MAVVGDVVLPGDEVLCCEGSSPDTKILLGPGLRQDSNSVIAVKPGIVRGGRSNTFWVESHEKRVNNNIIIIMWMNEIDLNSLVTSVYVQVCVVFHSLVETWIKMLHLNSFKIALY